MPPNIGRANKVCVFIDNSALFAALHKLGVKGRLDYRRLLHWLLQDREPVVVRFYAGEIRNDRGIRQKFYEFLRSLGIEVIALHEPRSSADHAAGDMLLQTKVHSLLRIDMDNFQPTCESVVLVSDSADLVDIVSQMQSKGSEVEVAFFGNACSSELAVQADRFRELEAENIQLRDVRREKVYT